MSSLAVFETADALAAAAAAAIATRAAATRERAERFRLALSGGRTPVAAYRLLGAGQVRPAVDWSRVEIFFADERAVPPTEPESNYWEARKLLIEPAHVPPAQVHRMKADDPELERAAAEYDALLAAPLDLLVLGIGEDGHTASLFPGSPWIAERVRRVAAVLDSPKPPPRRLTITARVIAEARSTLVLASGSDKAPAMARVFGDDPDAREVPARLARGGEWLVDRAAAGQLRARP